MKIFNSEKIIFNRHSFIIGLCLIACMVLLIRLFQKQVVQAKYYRTLARQQYYKLEDVPASRGNIYVKDLWEKEPYLVATNNHKYSILIVPRNLKNPTKTAQQLAPILQLNEKELYDKINNKKPYIPPIATKVDKENAKKIAELELPGVMLIPEEYRYYPENNYLSNVLGFVDLEHHGRYGLEGFYNEELKGKAGKGSVYNVDISQDKNEKTKNPQNGADLYLTIDHTVQYKVEKILASAVEKFGAESGEAVLADNFGRIIAMATTKNYNPNDYYKVEDNNVFNNPIVSANYEPGSIFKPITMSAAINEGKVTPETTSLFGASVQVKDRTIKTSTGKAYGYENMTQVLENSDNVAMVWVVQKIGSELFSKYLEGYGFGQRTGIDLDNEAQGSISTGKNLTDVIMATSAFGQGLAVTPLQMLNSYIAFANNGKIYQPYIVEKIVQSDGKVIEKNPKEIRSVIKPEVAKTITQMLVSVVQKGHGKQAGVKGYKIAGKTGTAQIPDPVHGGYIENQNIGSFEGFFPADNPKFVLITKINVPKNVVWAEESAAPVFGEIAKWVLQYYQIPPTEK